MFKKEFSRFVDGLRELCDVSSSAAQALDGEAPRNAGLKKGLFEPHEFGGWGVEVLAAMKLAANVVSDRPTGNGADWGQCSVGLSAYGVEYITGGGLRFGWQVHSSDYQWSRELDGQGGGNRWTFFVQHPAGVAPKGSTLRESALSHEWEEQVAKAATA